MDGTESSFVTTLFCVCMLCVGVCVFLGLWLLQVQAENDFMKQHLGIEKVNGGEGVQFAEGSWVLKNTQDFRDCKLLLDYEVKLWEDLSRERQIKQNDGENMRSCPTT